jgi:hypothetical protein
MSEKEDIYSIGGIEWLIKKFLRDSNLITSISHYSNSAPKDVYGIAVIEARGNDRDVRGYAFYPGVPRDKARIRAYTMPDLESKNLKKHAEAALEFLKSGVRMGQDSDTSASLLHYSAPDDVYGIIVIEARGSDRYVRSYRFYPNIPPDKAEMLAYTMPDFESKLLNKHSEAVREFLSRLD